MFGLAKKAEAQMQTLKEISNFDYIDAQVMERVKPDHEPRDVEREKAKEQARVFAAGFLISDPDQERAALDKLIADRNKSIQTFIDDRSKVRMKLDKLGIKPLAVVPSKAWSAICQQAGLVVMHPNAQGKITVSYTAIKKYATAKQLEDWAKVNHAGYVKELLPWEPHQGIPASLVLPTPPADVAAILLKAKALDLHVAAEPEAVQFVETPTELWNNTKHPKDEWARRQGYADYADWVKRDPIVFHQEGTAAAVIAQFGDFPIEKKVVDLVMAGDNLIPDQPEKLTVAAGSYTSLFGAGGGAQNMRDVIYQQMLEGQERSRYDELVRQAQAGLMYGQFGQFPQR